MPEATPLRLPEFAARYGITERHARDLVRRREVPFRKVGRLLMFDPAETDRWWDDLKVEAS